MFNLLRHMLSLLSYIVYSITNWFTQTLDIEEMCQAHGYSVQEHIVVTRDGYILCLHRITKSERIGSRVAYLHHGLMTNSELFVVGDTKERCLPFVLVDKGYDVWLGNNRVNKYSRKHAILSSLSPEFWDFSLDEFALYDIPDTIDYILDTTAQQSLCFIGFSQGSSQAFASISLHGSPLESKISQFVALSPIVFPHTLKHPLGRCIVQNPWLLYLIFGKRAMFSTAVFWEAVLGQHMYLNIIDFSLKWLFGWQGNNISQSQKHMAYARMFSLSSVKSVIHWFQIINNKRFQMYYEGLPNKLTKTTNYPIRKLKLPMLLIYGGSDTLCDMASTRRVLPKHAVLVRVPGYEHMDVLWASDVVETTFKKVVETLAEGEKAPVDAFFV